MNYQASKSKLRNLLAGLDLSTAPAGPYPSDQHKPLLPCLTYVLRVAYAPREELHAPVSFRGTQPSAARRERIRGRRRLLFFFPSRLAAFRPLPTPTCSFRPPTPARSSQAATAQTRPRPNPFPARSPTRDVSGRYGRRGSTPFPGHLEPSRNPSRWAIRSPSRRSPPHLSTAAATLHSLGLCFLPSQERKEPRAPPWPHGHKSQSTEPLRSPSTRRHLVATEPPAPHRTKEEEEKGRRSRGDRRSRCCRRTTSPPPFALTGEEDRTAAGARRLHRPTTSTTPASTRGNSASPTASRRRRRRVGARRILLENRRSC
jgi:hypothetical protein